MSGSLKFALLTGALLWASCGGDPAEDAAATDVGTAEQAIIPQCFPGQNTRIHFYNDAAKTDQIGQRNCSCNGTVTTYGRVSSVWTRFEIPCNW
jgi:hypothetical protein